MLRYIYDLFFFGLIFFVRLLYPFIIIRFGPLRSERIGHFSGNTEQYLCRRDVRLDNPSTLDIFYHTSPISNHQLKKMWDRTLHVNRFAKILDYYNKMIPGSEKHIIPWPASADRDPLGLLFKIPKHLYFTTDEEKFGTDFLKNIGLNSSDPFVCFSARDSAFLKDVFPERNWSYHEYRNSDIRNYIPSMEALVERNYFVFRMGAKVTQSIIVNNNRIIDYATNGLRTEFLDIYLSANCSFFVSSPSGLDNIPKIFRKPVLHVNYLPIENAHTWDPRDIFIPKKLWWTDKGRFMTYNEIFNFGVGRFLRTEYYKDYGLEIIENTPDEITSVVIEMTERLNGNWQATNEDDELQRKFWDIFPKSELHGKIRSRIGAEFLRYNRDLFI